MYFPLLFFYECLSRGSGACRERQYFFRDFRLFPFAFVAGEPRVEIPAAG